MQAAPNFIPENQAVPSKGNGGSHASTAQKAGIPIWGLAVIVLELGLIYGMISYNLNHVPRSDVQKIYSNVGNAVKRTFK